MASARYFPAINYLQSYSGYSRNVESWWHKKVGSGWLELREKAMNILQEDAKLQNIVKLLGEEALPDDQKRIIEGARLLKNDFLQQSAFDAVDTYASPQKQFLLLEIILHFFDRLAEVVASRIPLFRALELEAVLEIHRLKFSQKCDDPASIQALREQIDQEIDTLLQRHHESSF